MKKQAIAVAIVALAAFAEAKMTEVPSMPATARRGFKTFLDTIPLETGNYDIVFTFGDKERPTANWVKFEGRRIALENVRTMPSEFRKASFTARVKGPVASEDAPTGESPYPYALNLTVVTSADCVADPEIRTNVSARVIYLCGDSTVTDQQCEPWGSWGQALPLFFKEGTAVANFARSGLTTQSFIQKGRLDRILANIKPGDVVLVQFGHNDQKVEKLGPQGGYKEKLNYYVDKITEKGAKVVILSPVERLRFNNASGKQEGRTLAEYATAAREVAEAREVAFIDLNDASYRIYGALGAKDATRLFCYATIEGQVRDYFGEAGLPDGKPLRNLADKSHHSIYGAYVLAHFIADRLVEVVPELRESRRPGYVPLDIAAPDQDPAIPPTGLTGIPK